MRITSHPLRGSAATKAIRRSKVFDPSARIHLRFVELSDVDFIGAVSPGPSLAIRRRWIQHDKFLESEGREFHFVVVVDGQDEGLVRINDFADVDGEASFGWGDFASHEPRLRTAAALMIYSLGFETLGFGRAHMVVPRGNPEESEFHISMGAEIECDDGEQLYLRFGADAYSKIKDEALQRLVIVAERA